MISEIDFGREADELTALVEVRQRQAARAALRSSLLDRRGDRVRVAACLHLLPATVERELAAQRASLDDTLAVLRHCDPRLDPRCESMFEHAQRMHERVIDQLAQFVCEFDVTASGELGDELVTEVDRIVDSELIRLIPSALLDPHIARLHGPTTVHFTLVDFDLDSVERVRAFAASVGQIAERIELAERHRRLEALRAEVPAPRAILAAADERRERALRELDMVRAVRAAVEEVQRASAAGEVAGSAERPELTGQI